MIQVGSLYRWVHDTGGLVITGGRIQVGAYRWALDTGGRMITGGMIQVGS